EATDKLVRETGDEDVASVVAEMEDEMLTAAQNLEFEKAAMLRDQIDALQSGKTGTEGSSKTGNPKKKKNKKPVYNAKGLPRKKKRN
ncbi:MAG: UvrB/UvrC motif-containing protein, partial [Opitutales bacterium]